MFLNYSAGETGKSKLKLNNNIASNIQSEISEMERIKQSNCQRSIIVGGITPLHNQLIWQQKEPASFTFIQHT